MRVAAILACAAMVLCFGVRPGQADKRVALVVGNDSYANLPAEQQLKKAVNDARAVGDALEGLGFAVLRGDNLGRQALVDRFDEMLRRLDRGDTAFFFFAGHGVTVGGGNYILPADVPNIEAGQDMRLVHAALGEGDIVTDLQARGVRVAVVVLDACRNNPFKQPGVRSVGGERGLQRIEPVRGVFTLYSAGIGQTALDRLSDSDTNPNSVFTRVFVPVLSKPGMGLGDLAVEVREEVTRLAASVNHDQNPAYYDQTIGGRIYLAGAPRPDGGTPAAAATGPAADEIAWSYLRATSDVVALRRFVTESPQSTHKGDAQARIALLEQEAARKKAEEERQKLAAAVGSTEQASPPTLIAPPGPLAPERARALKPKDSFKECETCPQMTVVSAGTFTMGSPKGEEGRSEDEGPQQPIEIRQALAVGRSEVSFEEWLACVAEGGCNAYRPGDYGWGYGKSPVILVSWTDASAYVTWLSRKTGATYRLLSEAEWEYAARGCAVACPSTPFWFGNEISSARANYDSRISYAGSPKAQSPRRTVAIDTGQPNPFGLLHMLGNVSEWVADCWNPNLAGQPRDGAARTAGDCNSRVVRGGSWHDEPKDLRSAKRSWEVVGERRAEIGFRVARTLP
ncbi:MAG: SUMF1/EgtB/PvdO family nonheme iron enzyme [Xanthobacteraceae bacterium]